MDLSPALICWNVCGLNNPAKRKAIKEFIGTVKINIACLQETKLDVIDKYIVMQCLGLSFDGFAYVPSEETRGGILLAWESTVVDVVGVQSDTNFLTGWVQPKGSAPWWISVVYGPQGDELKSKFLEDMSARRVGCPGAWMILGDFNMILRASEKSNSNLNRGMMNKFRHFVDEHELKELYMHGRRFMWSNEREVPTLTKIDRVLVSVDWELDHTDSLLQALSSGVSDHAPLHLTTSAPFFHKKRFRFEMSWLKLEGFEDLVREAWVCDERITDPFKRLDAKLHSTATALQAWGQRKTGNIKLQMAVANWIVFRFDKVMESRQLTELERWLRNTLKLSLLGLASLQRTIDRQRSRFRWLREGDANTKFFQAFANGRRAKNFIPLVKHGDEVVTNPDRMEEVFSEAYQALIGTAHARGYTLDLDYLGMESVNLDDLEAIFTEEEVWAVIKELHPDRAPGPDGFIGAFYQKAWPIIKHDIMAVLLKIYVGDGRGFTKLNRALIVLLPKKPDAERVGDYRPISLPHSMSKIFAKLLAMRVRTFMKDLVTINQSAFIKGRNLHDNFLLVRQVARRIAARKSKGVFLKLDISRAFDSLSWPFLFEVLRAKGFGKKWIKWVSILLQSATTKILVNSVPGRSIAHACGLRQGDPVSPLLFVIAMDALTAIFGKALEEGVISTYRGISAWQRISIYADDVALFIYPTHTDLSFIKQALDMFGEASGLRVNYMKSTATLIHGEQEDKERVLGLLQCNLAEFPCRYLGLQLAIKQLTKQDWQPLLDMVRKFMPAWHRGLLQRSGRLVLAKSVIAARPVHQLLVLQPPVWVLEDINSWMRSFFWAGKDRVNGGQCLVAWDKICRPIQYGGLGIKNLKVQALALRVRWEWLWRTEPERPWQGLGLLVDQEARAVFDCLVHIVVGRGEKVLLWRDRWIHGHSVQEIAPLILELVDTRSINSRTVQWALEGEQWSADIPDITSHMALLQLMHLRQAIASVHRDTQMPDTFLWPCATSTRYSAKSTYDRLCEGLPTCPYAAAIWRSWAPLKCKIFTWLAAQYRLWTADRRTRHGLQEHTSACYTCLQEEDTVDHILVQCGYARGTWLGCFDALHLPEGNGHIPGLVDTTTFMLHKGG